MRLNFNSVRWGGDGGLGVDCGIKKYKGGIRVDGQEDGDGGEKWGLFWCLSTCCGKG